jgi:hypothetical protein
VNSDSRATEIGPYWEIPLTGDKPFDFQMLTAIVKAF